VGSQEQPEPDDGMVSLERPGSEDELVSLSPDSAGEECGVPLR
jgi:hypothetical protein